MVEGTLNKRVADLEWEHGEDRQLLLTMNERLQGVESVLLAHSKS